MEGRPLAAHEAADILIRMPKERGLWQTIDFIVDRYFRLNPEMAKKQAAFIKATKSSQKNQFGASEKRVGKITEIGGMRHLGEIPEEIYLILDKVCVDQIKEYGDKKFYHEFFRRYPVFSVADKI